MAAAGLAGCAAVASTAPVAARRTAAGRGAKLTALSPRHSEYTMPGLLPTVDPDGLLEYSVVYTDRALNHMSQRFQGVMRDISGVLKEVYGARSAVVVP